MGVKPPLGDGGKVIPPKPLSLDLQKQENLGKMLLGYPQEGKKT